MARTRHASSHTSSPRGWAGAREAEHGHATARGAHRRHAPGRAGARARRAAPAPGTRSSTCRSSRSSRSATSPSTSRLRLGRHHERERCPRAAPTDGGTPDAGRGDRPATADAFGGADLVAASRPRKGCSRRFRATPGRVLFAAAEGARRLLPDALGADVVRSTERSSSRRRPARLGPRRPRLTLGRAGARPRRPRTPAVSIGPETTRAAGEAGLAVVAEARPTTRRPRRGGRAGARRVVDSTKDGHLLPHRLRAAGRLRRHVSRRDRADRARSRVIDVTHGIPPTAVMQGALVLASTLPYMPVGVHLAVVDPGVGGVRRALALADAEGGCSSGPDNGLLLPAAERAGIAEARELANPEYALESISRTFHGRDLFAPAAAHLASGVAARGARPTARSRCARSARPARARVLARAHRRDDALRRQLRQHRPQPRAATTSSRSGRPGPRVELELGGERYYAVDRADVRRRPCGRRDPVRGQLPQHVDCDQPR